MTALLKKEIVSQLSSISTYLIISIFLLIAGLWFWVFEDSSLLNYGFADLDSFFNWCPYILLFFIPAIAMKSFSEEYRTGTIELLFSKPITNFDLVWSKFLGTYLVIFFGILLTIIYPISIYFLGSPVGNIDVASTVGSYLGLFLLAASFTSISIFASSLTSNQVMAFFTGCLVCYFFWDGIGQLAEFFRGQTQFFIDYFSLHYHYSALGRGLLKTENIIYILSLTSLFFYFTYITLAKKYL